MTRETVIGLTPARWATSSMLAIRRLPRSPAPPQIYGDSILTTLLCLASVSIDNVINWWPGMSDSELCRLLMTPTSPRMTFPTTAGGADLGKTFDQWQSQ